MSVIREQCSETITSQPACPALGGPQDGPNPPRPRLEPWMDPGLGANPIAIARAALIDSGYRPSEPYCHPGAVLNCTGAAATVRAARRFSLTLQLLRQAATSRGFCTRSSLARVESSWRESDIAPHPRCCLGSGRGEFHEPSPAIRPTSALAPSAYCAIAAAGSDRNRVRGQELAICVKLFSGSASAGAVRGGGGEHCAGRCWIGDGGAGRPERAGHAGRTGAMGFRRGTRRSARPARCRTAQRVIPRKVRARPYIPVRIRRNRSSSAAVTAAVHGTRWHGV